MSTTAEEFEEFRREVVYWQSVAATDPSRARSSAISFALLGYAYILGAAILLPVLCVGTAILLAETHLGVIAVKLLLPLGLLWVSIVRALWVRIAPPAGKELTRAQFPALFNLIDEVAAKIGAPKPDHVLLTGTCNASLVQYAVLGPFGWYRNYLELGWPLMQVLSRDQFRAIVAHELGHLAGGHGRATTWIYRQRVSWGRLLHQIEEGRTGSRWGGAIFARFVHWYQPKFAARSFVLSREHEFEADRCSVLATGADSAASAMVRLHLFGNWVEDRYAPGLITANLAAGVHDAPGHYLRDLSAAFSKPLDSAYLTAWGARVWVLPTDYEDTHPSFKDRLRAMGLPSLTDLDRLAAPPGHPAGAAYLGESNDALGATFDAAWLEAARDGWKRGLDEARQQRRELEALIAQEQAGQQGEEARLERVRLARELDESSLEAEATRFVADYPENAIGHFFLGSALLRRNDAGGIEHLSRAAEINPELEQAAAGQIFKFHWSEGRIAEADAARGRYLRLRSTSEAAAREHRLITADTVYAPHELSTEQGDALKASLAKFPQLSELRLARRVSRVPTPKPRHVLVMRFHRSWFAFHGKGTAARERTLCNQILALPGWPEGTTGFVLTSAQKKLLKRIRKVPGSDLLARG